MAVAAPALDLKQLPLRALLAYAARCARRVQPLFTIAPEHADPAQAAQAIDTAILLGEEFAAGADLDPQILAEAEEAVVQILMAGGSGDGLEKGAAYAANAAYGVISATRAAVESGTADDPSAAAQLVTECATIVADAAIAADASVERAARLDWEMLHRMRLGKFPALGDAINPAPTGMLGPLFCSQTRRSNDENTAGDRLTGREPPPRSAPRPEPPPREEEPSDSLRLDRIDPPKKQVSPQIQELVEELQEQRKQLEEEAAALREEKEAFELARSVFKDDHQRKKNELKAEQEKLKSLAADLQRREEDLAHRDEEFAQREEELSQRAEELSQRETSLADREKKLTEAEAALNGARAKFEEEQSRSRSENAAGADLRSQLDAERAQLESARAELESQRAALHEQVEQFQAAVEAFQAEKERGGESGGSQELAGELQNERMEKEQLQKQMRMLQQEFERLEGEKEQLAAELERLGAAAETSENAAPVRPAAERAPAREAAPRPRPTAPAPRAARDEELGPVRFLVEPGSATSMQLAELLHEMNILYRQLGGDGIRYQMGACRVWARPDGSDQRRSVVELLATPAPPPGGLKGTIDPTLWEQLRSCLVMSMSVDEGLTTCFSESQTAPNDHPAHRLVASAAKRAMTAYAARRNDATNGGGGLPIDAVNVQVKRIEQFLRALAKEKCCLLEISTVEFQSSASAAKNQGAPQAGESEKSRGGWFGRWRS